MVTFRKYKERVGEIMEESKCLCRECGKPFSPAKDYQISENAKVISEAAKADCNGVIVYHGVSNGENIVAIATGLVKESENRKTGSMVQIWILHADVSPTDAIESGKDVGICGDCIHRKGKGGACYVNPGQAPNQIFDSFKKGNYPYIVDAIKKFEGGDITDVYVKDGMWDLFSRSFVRFGAYGDPSFIPLPIIEKIAENCKGFTGYTHQWKKANSEYQKYFMASVDFAWEYDLAKKLGWRTFRVSPEWTNKKSGEIPCLNSLKGLKCIDCLLCSGTSSKAKDIYIKVHGATAKRFIEKFGTDEDNFDTDLTPTDLKNIEEIEQREKEEKKGGNGKKPKKEESPLSAMRRAMKLD